MGWFWLFVLFAGKHFLITNVFDIGVSKSRMLKTMRWRRWLAISIFAELTATYFIVASVGSQFNVVIGMCEAAILVLGCLFERKTFMGTSLATHLLTESMIYFFYLYTILVYSPRYTFILN